MSVIKLLYQADPRNRGTVIALRPETEDPLPCVLTLDQSPLEEAKYEIITHGNLNIVSLLSRAGWGGGGDSLARPLWRCTIHKGHDFVSRPRIG